MKRRAFIIKSGLATAAIASSSAVAANILHTKNANSSINIGVIGTGDRGAGLTPLINQIENLNVSACCDILPFRLENGIKKAEGKAKGYKNYKALLDDKNIDAVVIATTFSTHSKIAIDAIDAGKHVYCEKTLAKGFDGINSLVKKVKNSKYIFQTGHQYHSSRLYTHVVDLIKNGQVGKISTIECQWNRNGNWRRPVPSPELEKAVNWRMYREFSGGLVAELCSHQIDFVNWVLEATPDKVLGIGGIDYWKDGRETYDNVHLIYSYPNGVKATFISLTSNAKDGYQIKVMGDKGTIILGTSSAWFYPEGKIKKKLGDIDGVSSATASFIEGKGYPINVEHANPSKQALLDFKNSIINNTTLISNIETGAKAAICVQMALDAMHNEKIVVWNSQSVKF